jgi:hypothetical protein
MSESAALAPSPPASEPAARPTRFWLVDWLRSHHLKWILLVALYVIVQPPEQGLAKWGVPEMCALKRITGAPCPGCGMTRAGANMIRGDFRRSFQFHPFGIVFIPTLFGLAALSLLPATVRSVLARGVERRVRWFRSFYSVTIIAFLVFGLVRWILVMANALSFPLDGP